MKIQSIQNTQNQRVSKMSNPAFGNKTGNLLNKTELIFLGPPACGKGTQTSRLAEYLRIPHVDTGSLLRGEIAKATEEGQVAKSFIAKGLLVPFSLVAKIITKKLASEECANGYILDGFPRNVEQAEELERINSGVDKDKKASFKAIFFDIDPKLLLERVIYRQSCPSCGEIYNKKFKPSKVEDQCDKCHVELKTRADDNAETAKARFDTYFKETAPVVEFYEKKGVLNKIDANGSIEEVWQRLLNAIKK